VSALPAATPAARRYVEDALAILEAQALGRPAAGWAALREAAFAYARGARTDADAHLAVRYAVAALGDRHSYFQTPQATAALRLGAVANARTGQALAAPAATVLEGGVAYLAVPGFAGGAPTAQVEFAESIKKLIQQHDFLASCGWVLDLRQNGGGNLWPMLAGVGPLLGNGAVGASVYPDGRRVPVWYRDGQAGFGDYVQLRVNDVYSPARLPAVAVLMGPGTGSSAEVLALAFHGRPDARSFGARTAGVSTGTRTFALADGAALILAVAATSDRLGRVYTGPLEPDEAVPGEATGREPAADSLVAVARRWLKARDGCRAGAL
jgi:C-terminal processing protease CtpA/Prc